jgi:hypothetical protein
VLSADTGGVNLDPSHATLLTYAAPCAYLTVVVGFLYAQGRVPWVIHLTGLATGLALGLSGPTPLAYLVPVIAAAVVFVVLVLLVGNTVSGVTVFTLSVTLATTPLDGWPGLLIGLVLAAVVATRRTVRNLGKGHVAWLAMDTMNAVGITPAGGFRKPDLGLIPNRDALVDANSNSEQATAMRMYLPPYLLFGLAVSFAYAVGAA